MSFASFRLSVGDRIPAFKLPSQTGEIQEIGDFVGKPLVICFYPTVRTLDASGLLCGFQEAIAQFQKLSVPVIGISTDSVAVHQGFANQYGISFPLLSDLDAKVCTNYGIARKSWVDFREGLTAGYGIIVTDTNYRVIKIYEDFDAFTICDRLLADLKDLLSTETPRQILQQAPVLLIPNVFDPEFCQHLIQIWHTQGNGESGFMRQVEGKTVPLIDYSHKIRRDHFLQPGETKDKIKQYLGRRVTPEIWKAFHFNATRIEDFRIVCYDASHGGYFRPHRDNTTSGTAHRVFAMTINLNVGEYEGGYLRFPEFGPHLYRPNTGSAVVFSCSLLHEATDVTAGRRFAMLTFFYGEEEARKRNEYMTQAMSKASV